MHGQNHIKPLRVSLLPPYFPHPLTHLILDSVCAKMIIIIIYYFHALYPTKLGGKRPKYWNNTVARYLNF